MKQRSNGRDTSNDTNTDANTDMSAAGVGVHDGVHDGDEDGVREPKSSDQNTTEAPAKTLVKTRTPTTPQGRTAWLPLQRPPDDCTPEEWAAYRRERRRRRILKAGRRARIARREQPHDVKGCPICRAIPERDLETHYTEVAKRAKCSPSHAYRVLFAKEKKDQRGMKTLSMMRRIAHDGLGITLDELAILLKIQ